MGYNPQRWALQLLLLLSVCNLGTAQNSEFSRMDLLEDEIQLKSGDRIQYFVIEEQNSPVVIQIDADGQLRIPYIGNVYANGKTPKLLAQEVKSRLEVDFFYRATVIMNLAQADIRELITIYGQVMKQGKLALPETGSMSLSTAITQAGGFNTGADLQTVTVVRRDVENPDLEERIVVNMEEVMRQGRVDMDIDLQPDDVVIVAKLDDIGGQYSVHGAVNNPGLYPIQSRDLTVFDAILLAGGFTEVARTSRVKLTRASKEEEGEVETLYINVARIIDGDRSLDVNVEPDDIIKVDERIIVF